MTSTRLRTTKRAGAVALAIAAGSTGIIASTAGSASASSLNLAAVRACESGGNYSTNTGNGFYGAYQFDQQTWSGLGFSGSPSSASPATQDAAAQKLYSQRGTSPWPVCGASTSGSSSSNSGYQPSASRSYSRTPVRETTTPTRHSSTVSNAASKVSSFTGVVILDQRLEAQKRTDVKLVQHRLNKHGANLVEDGQFGPLTTAAAKQYQAHHGLAVDGRVGPATQSSLRNS